MLRVGSIESAGKRLEPALEDFVDALEPQKDRWGQQWIDGALDGAQGSSTGPLGRRAECGVPVRALGFTVATAEWAESVASSGAAGDEAGLALAGGETVSDRRGRSAHGLLEERGIEVAHGLQYVIGGGAHRLPVFDQGDPCGSCKGRDLA